MRRSAITIALGAVLLIAAAAGFVIVPEHAPNIVTLLNGVDTPCEPAAGCATVNRGLSQTVYDILRIATWALLIVGALLVIVGLINYARRTRETAV